MYLLDFSIDNISLLGLTLAVGLVVDDAIVMLENIVRHIEEGMQPFEAALKGSREIGFTIISITVSLVAVFIPVLLMGGVIGRVFHEFAVVVTMAIAASAFVSLTLTPMLCARLLKPMRARARAGGLLDRVLEGGFNAMLAVYDAILKFCLRFKPLMLLVFFATVAATVWLCIRDPQGILSAGGHRPALGVDGGARGHILRRHGRIAAAGRRCVPAVALCEERLERRGQRRQFRQFRALVRGVEAQERAAGAAGRPERPAPRAVADRRHIDLHVAGAEPAPRRTVIAQPVPVRAAGGRQGLALRLVREGGGRDGAAIRISRTSAATWRTARSRCR